MADPSHFLFNSDYPTDKIAFATTGSHTYASPSGVKYVYINTHVPTMLYAEGDYKIRGSNASYSMEDGYDSDARLITFMYNGECWVGLELQYYDDSYGKIMDYRIWAYYGEEDGKNADIGATANITNRKLIFNSDENYPRFLADGYIVMGGWHPHGLGYIPIVKTWTQSPERSIPNPNGGGNINVQYYYKAPIGYFGNADISSYSADIIHVTNEHIWTHARQYPGDGVGVYYRIYNI